MKKSIRSAIILAAGVGSRMLGTIDHPKSMIMIKEQSLISHLINDLIRHGITRIVINTHYKADMLEEHVRKLEAFAQIQILFSREIELLETAGGIKKALPLIDDEIFFALNSDVYSVPIPNSPLDTLTSNWLPKMEALLLLIKKEKAIGDYGQGDFSLNKNNNLMIEDIKPYVYAGTQILTAKFFDDVILEKRSLVHYWQKRKIGSKISGMYGAVFEGTWLHLGDPESHKNAEHYLISLEKESFKA